MPVNLKKKLNVKRITVNRSQIDIRNKKRLENSLTESIIL
jgi:hypothetical protein